jgi:hypothetical protein
MLVLCGSPGLGADAVRRPSADIPGASAPVGNSAAPAPAENSATPAASSATLGAAAIGPPALQAIAPAPAPSGIAIAWEVANRFRLFRDERDFRRHVEALRGKSVLEAEQALAEATDGRGWARDMMGRLCVDAVGRLTAQCVRDGVTESYLAPADHRIEARLVGSVPTGATCTWSFSSGEASPPTDCVRPARFRAPSGRPVAASVDVTLAGEIVGRAGAEIAVRDLMIAGLGDSVASGDGNPDWPVALADDGFCFRRFLATDRAEYFRPGRIGFSGDRACDSDSRGDQVAWSLLSARWMSAACHGSLYGYQLRAALALAVETPHAAVTFLPLACTGATIATGLLNGQRARELNCGSGGARGTGTTACPTTMPAQLAALRDLLAEARRRDPGRVLDLVFLTVGANDIGFSGLIADAIIEARAERTLFSRAGVISSVEAAQQTLEQTLPGDFARLRAALKPLVGGMMERVVFVPYGNPALRPGGGPCPGGRGGFDIHPAFGVDAERLRSIAGFVQDKFLPALKTMATCTAKGSASGACAVAGDAMTFVDEHQAAFAGHGFCARADTDPPFDRECFSADGKSFTDSLVAGATDPLVCAPSVSEFRAYAPRARWIRTANDSYFAAMTFPEGIGAGLQPSDLHDAAWGVLSAVYGGAIHPTAEGHAAMADAALAGAKNALQLAPADPPITTEPLPPLPGTPAPPLYATPQ